MSQNYNTQYVQYPQQDITINPSLNSLNQCAGPYAQIQYVPIQQSLYNNTAQSIQNVQPHLVSQPMQPSTSAAQYYPVVPVQSQSQAESAPDDWKHVHNKKKKSN
uniref:Uncharacterized protein LOC114341712 isoform X3 n=1 Tax=Diabrotica virgifera virgifera TaxID=50390 RepID=A0A6P7GFC9_DIAVI